MKVAAVGPVPSAVRALLPGFSSRISYSHGHASAERNLSVRARSLSRGRSVFPLRERAPRASSASGSALRALPPALRAVSTSFPPFSRQLQKFAGGGSAEWTRCGSSLVADPQGPSFIEGPSYLPASKQAANTARFSVVTHASVCLVLCSPLLCCWEQPCPVHRAGRPRRSAHSRRSRRASYRPAEGRGGK